MYLFFDTETTGIPRNWKAPASDTANWPRIVQIAWMLVDESGGDVAACDYIVKPEGFTIPANATAIHGITTARAREEGVVLGGVLAEFASAAGRAAAVVAHNLDFDSRVTEAEFIRAGLADPFGRSKRICTMRAATDLCRLPGRYGYKWPTLTELHTKLFGRGFDEAHAAGADVRVLAKCFFELVKRGVIRPVRA